MLNHFDTLLHKDPDMRRQALADVLRAEGLSFTLQSEESSARAPRGIVNYLLNADTKDPALLFCAHYDAVPGSCGANDNAAAVCILLKLAKELKKRGLPAHFAFFDGEESGNTGSSLYVSEVTPDTLSGVINLDLCGYGDTLAICGKGNERKPALAPFCEKNFLKTHHGQLVKYLPPSDDASFSQKNIPSLSIAIVPAWDIQFLKALASYGGNLFGHTTPEFDMIVHQMEITSTIHGGHRDAPEWIDERAMRQVYDYLLEGLIHPPAVKSWKSMLPLSKKR